MERPRLVDDWKRVLRFSWSIRLIAIAGLFAGCEVALPLIALYVPIPPGVFAGLSGFFTAAALISRLLAQRKLAGDE
jgi:hypothetical protein